MIAEWMLYCAVCAGLAAIAGCCVERAAIGRGWPARAVWGSMLALSLALPIVALLGGRERRAVGTATAPRASVPAVVTQTTANQPTSSTTSYVAVAEPAWRARAAAFDGPLAIAWIATTVLLLAGWAAALVGLSLLRRRWQARIVAGVPVLISSRFGPAVAGVLRPKIVLPAWVLELDATAIGLLLRHEVEHQRSRDPLLLAIARLAAVIMPWNVALWWMLRRLHLAVELDCDARVLRAAPDVRSYGSLLLTIGAASERPMWVAAAAFADQPSQLERRIVAMTRGRNRVAWPSALASTLAAAALFTMACMAPVPATPVSTTPPPAARTGQPEPVVSDALRQLVSATAADQQALAQASGRISALAQQFATGALGCDSRLAGDTAQIRLVVLDNEVDVPQRVAVMTRDLGIDGVEMKALSAVSATNRVTCEMPSRGVIRAHGRLRGVVIFSHGLPDLTLTVVTRDSGRVIAGPFRANPEAGDFEVAWGKR